MPLKPSPKDSLSKKQDQRVSMILKASLVLSRFHEFGPVPVIAIQTVPALVKD